MGVNQLQGSYALRRTWHLTSARTTRWSLGPPQESIRLSWGRWKTPAPTVQMSWRRLTKQPVHQLITVCLDAIIPTNRSPTNMETCCGPGSTAAAAPHCCSLCPDSYLEQEQSLSNEPDGRKRGLSQISHHWRQMLVLLLLAVENNPVISTHTDRRRPTYTQWRVQLSPRTCAGTESNLWSPPLLLCWAPRKVWLVHPPGTRSKGSHVDRKHLEGQVWVPWTCCTNHLKVFY